MSTRKQEMDEEANLAAVTPEVADGDVLPVNNYRYTMAEAARLKGVSYHTVSRAVRRGKLPVHRLGRMALIAADDLRAWRPMRERAPKKYRRREPMPDATPALLDLASGQRVDLARRLSTLYEVIHTAAVERSLTEFAALLCDRFAEVLDLSRVMIWQIDEDLGIGTRIAQRGPSMSDLPDRLPLANLPGFMVRAASDRAQIIDDIRTEVPNLESYIGERSVSALFAAPLRAGGRSLGVVFGDRDGASFSLRDDQLALAQGLANQGALAFENARLRAREEARADQLATILEDLSDAVTACDAQGRLTVINAADRALLGAPSEEVKVGDTVARLLGCVEWTTLDGAPLRPEETPLLRALAGERVQNMEHLVRRKDGTVRMTQVNARPIRINGLISGAVSVGRDVTDEREADQRDERRLTQLERATARAHAVADLMLAVNAGTEVADVLATAIAGMVQQLDGANGTIVLRGEDGRMHLRAAYNFEPSDDFRQSYDLVTLPNTVLAFARGEPFYLSRDDAGPAEREVFDQLGATSALIVPLIYGDEQRGVAYVNYHEPRTLTEDDLGFAATLARQCTVAIEKAQLIEASEADHRRLLAVLHQLPQAVLIMAYPRGEVVIANQAAEQLWQVQLSGRQALAGTLAFIDDEGRPVEQEHNPLMRTLRTGRSSFGEPLTVRRADDSSVEVLANHAPILDAQGNLAGAVSLLQDRAHFKPLDRARDEFLSVVAHELRTPLTSLRGNLQLLERRTRKGGEVSSEEERARLTTVIEQVDRLTELVSRLLDISRADLGKLALSLAEGDATAIVHAAAVEAQGMSKDRPIQVTAPDQAMVIWDTVRVEQILANLLSNAVRYAPDGGIDVTLEESSADVVRIAVRDYGPGVPERIKRRLFTRYYRSDDGGDEQSDRHEPNQGLGIGLYISARLARAHGGTLEVDDAKGGGAVFVLTLPRDASRATENG
ncbi:MAG: GAF domain-containing protein [Chloroflexia bacterium]|nr:GAF domain-containing protein [Chloroflexia bacterium]MBA3643353.1 GAF domain-containing protein [Chloroflexia bacterium]